VKGEERAAEAEEEREMAKKGARHTITGGEIAGRGRKTRGRPCRREKKSVAWEVVPEKTPNCSFAL